MAAHVSPEVPPPPRPDEHAAAAEELLALALRMPEGSTRRLATVAEAQLHAQLALLGLTSSAMQPQRVVLGADPTPAELEAAAKGAVLWAAPVVAMPEDVDPDVAAATLTHPPAVARRRSTPKKKETAE